ncbi:hypothetical protein RZS08_62695, partial [Arthrospira platensis SPKY1]|nr:hypothetical protein [Arthrospira platensis SPKY1]
MRACCTGNRAGALRPPAHAGSTQTPAVHSGCPRYLSAEIDALARREGFVSYPIRTLDELLAEVAAGHPVLVLQNLGTDWLTQWHFA